MKYLYISFVLFSMGCASIENERAFPKLQSYCPDRDSNVLKLQEGQNFDEAFKIFNTQREKEVYARRAKTVALIGDNIDPIVLGTMRWVDQSICMSVIGAEPSIYILDKYKEKGINLRNCFNDSPYMSITSIDTLEKPGTYAVHFTSGCGGSECSSARVYKLVCANGKCTKVEEQLCWIT